MMTSGASVEQQQLNMVQRTSSDEVSIRTHVRLSKEVGSIAVLCELPDGGGSLCFAAEKGAGTHGGRRASEA